MIIKVADFGFRIDKCSTITQKTCEDFICPDTEKVDAQINLTLEEINAEVVRSSKTRNAYNRALSEGSAIYRKICSYALSHDAFVMHGAVIEYQGKGFLFTAQSGTGKTTHILQWKKAFGDENVVIINGDKPIIRFIDDKVYAYGTPWNGKEHYGTTGRTELSAICFLKRGDENKIRPCSSEEAVPLMFSQIMITDSTDLAKQLELANRLVEKVPMYILECNISEEAARVSFAGMQSV